MRSRHLLDVTADTPASEVVFRQLRQLHQVPEETHLEVAMFVHWDGEPNGAARLPVDVVASVSAEQSPPLALDGAREVAAGD